MVTYQTGYGDISQRTAYHAVADMLENISPVCVLTKFGQSRPIPKNKSEAVKFRRADVYAAATVPLSEGVTPTAHQRISVQSIDCDASLAAKCPFPITSCSG